MPDNRNLQPDQEATVVAQKDPRNLWASFEAGEWYNQLVFNLSQAWFYPSDSFYRKSQEAVQKLRGLFPLLRSPHEDPKHFAALLQPCNTLLDKISNETHFDELDAESKDLAALGATLVAWNDYLYNPAERRENFLKPVIAMLDGIRQELVRGLQGDLALAFQLGELVDQGSCRKEIWRYLDYIPDVDDREAISTGAIPPPSAQPITFGGSRGNTEPVDRSMVGDVQHLTDGSVYVLAPRARRPGALPPDEAWFDSVQTLWSVLVPQSLLPQEFHEAHDGFKQNGKWPLPMELVARLQECAKTHFQEIANSSRAMPFPTSAAPGINIETRDEVHVPVNREIGSQPIDRPDSEVDQPLTASRRKKLLAIKKKVDPAGSYIGQSAGILRVFERIHQLNNPESKCILLLGETGVGKSEIARLIHDYSKRKNKSYREEQASGTLGADKSLVRARWVGVGERAGIPGVGSGQRKGLLEECEGGTIFLDEVDALDLDFQLMMLSAVERKPLSRVGGNASTFKPNVRFIFATNKSLEEYIAEGRFKHDLFARIRHGTIRIPRLRERREDIIRLTKHFLEKQNVKLRADAAQRLFLGFLKYGWPENVRELELALESGIGVAKAEEQELSLNHVHLGERGNQIFDDVLHLSNDAVKHELSRELEMILGSDGQRTRGLRGEIATLLGVSESTISRIMNPPSVS